MFDPVEIKRVKISNFDKHKWSDVADEIMEDGLMHKFVQNEDLEAYLLNTADKTLAEANPRDSVWGIGMGLLAPDVLDKEKWGENKLGKALMRVRNRLQQRISAQAS